MSHIRDILVEASRVNQGEMVSYVPTTFPYEKGLYFSVDLNVIKLQSRTQAGAIVLLFDYILKNGIPRWRRKLNVNLYEMMDESLDFINDYANDPEKLKYFIWYMFERGDELRLEKETVRNVVLV
jgi:hypothetical protein